MTRAPSTDEGSLVTSSRTTATTATPATGTTSPRSATPAGARSGRPDLNVVGDAPAQAPAKIEHGSRRESILDGASELFAEYGYYGASLRDISRRVGLSHPGMLHHFSSKDELLGGVIDRLEAHAQQALDRKEEFCSDGDALLRGLTEMWNPGSHLIQLLATLDADAISDDHPGRFRMARLRRVHEHVLEHCFVALEKNGQLRSCVDPEFASRAMLALILRDAVRERTVRTLQREDHNDSPVKDVCDLARTFLLDRTE
ncbi:MULTISPECIES: TetR/AcrR family transcriptional regulator [unclassified Brachybacterium]|uniref:TetR/AcrR family transcriptional regulator n=1 Tax=unclassified Brachybacterium TaxID=2623841 RepID=UPI003621D9F2